MMLVADEKSLREKIAKMKLGGAQTIQVVSDFDKTLTKAFFDGNKAMSSYAMLREYKYLGEEYSKQAFALFDKYHPYEIAKDLSFEERLQKMNEWWDEHLKLMLKSGIKKEIFRDIADKGYVKIRDGLHEFMDLLDLNEIPLLIFSAGLGDIIREVLIKNKLLKPKVKIIANFFKFEENGSVNGYHHGIVHVFNKNTISHNENIAERNNVILLGDNIDDLGMVKGISYDTIIRIGFLNDKIDGKREEYMREFDVVIVGDGNLSEVNELLRDILDK